MKKRKRPTMLRPASLDFLLARSTDLRGAPSTAPMPEPVWRSAVGGRIADRSTPVRLDRGLLVVRVASSAWASELSMLSEPILARLQALGVAVTELRFRVGDIPPPARPPERRITRHVPPPAKLSTELKSRIDEVQDDELRAILEDAASRTLGYMRNMSTETGEPLEPFDALKEKPVGRPKRG